MKTHDVAHISEADIREMRLALQGIAATADCMEHMATRIVDLLYDALRGPDGKPQCALVRLFKTCSQEELPPELRRDNALADGQDFRTLALLATRGDESAWNDRQLSAGHKAIPLESVEVVEKIPMISNLIRMLGLDLNSVVNPDPSLTVAGFYPMSVFYVREAAGSPYIPAQENFVQPYGIGSVVGFGGLLTYSDMYSVIMFFKVTVEQEVAALFKDLGSAVEDLISTYQQSGRIFSQT